MSNIAEGFARKTDRDFAHFLDMARGSCSEVQSLLYVALDVGYLSQQQFEGLYESADATAALISRLTTYLRSHDGAKRTPARTSATPKLNDSGLRTPNSAREEATCPAGGRSGIRAEQAILGA